MKRLIFALALLLALQSLGASRAIAQPALPSSFYGTVTYEGGSVSAGTKVSAWIDDVPYAETNVFLDGIQSVFAINVPADNPYTTEVETAEDTQGKAITFKVGTDKIKDITPTWQSGTNVRQDLAYYGNRLPEAEGQTLIVTAGVQVIITLHATDLDGDLLTYYRTSDPAHGTFIFDFPPGLIYLPNSDFPGEDRFNFEACDLEGCDEAEIFLRTNVAPVVIGASLPSFDEDTTLPINLGDYASDADEEDALNYEITVNPNHGVLSGTAPNLIYTPNANYYGSDSFTFKACDPFGACGEATINLTIDPVNDPPNANPITFTVFINTIDNELNLFYFEYPCPTPEDPSQTCKTYHVSDLEGDSVKWEIVDQPEHGAELAETSSTYMWRYTPDIDFSGTDTFSYRIKEDKTTEQYNSNTATVTINVIERPQSDFAIFLPLILK